ncbi:MAG TPA: TIGR02281 family clan AA aspartic protease [Burkholderiaceae bacterium]|nr:TIGR02281 family clan AA aspartic protease [Burkholderiaceae bacterium]
MTALRARLALAAALIAGVSAHAQTVALTGSLGSKALLVIDGTPRTVAVGGVVAGVRLVSLSGGQAVVEIDGKRQTLVLGGSPVRVGASGDAEGGRRIVLTAGSGGHFTTPGQINGRAVHFMVDTGATAVSMTVGDAQRIGLKYQQGQRIMLHTANGAIPAYAVMLDSVRIGDVEVRNVQGVVASREMPYVLLGNSFLTRFQMRRENDQLTLERRY